MKLVGNVTKMTASHLIVNGLAFLSVPFLIAHFGAEAFAAIAFYLAFQMWLVTFDLGFTPALIMDLAPRFNSRDNSRENVTDLVSAYRSVFMLSSACIILAFSIFFFVNETFERFLTSNVLGFSVLVALIGGLRFYVTVEKALYRASELFSRLAVLNVIFSILRYIMVFPFIGDSRSLFSFFEYQLLVAVAEVICYVLFNVRSTHQFYTIFTPKFSVIIPSRKLIGYSAVAGLMWLAIVNIDKFFLFGSVDDSVYSQYMVLLQFASLPMLLLAPVSGVVQPRIIRVLNDGGKVALVNFLIRYNIVLIPFVVCVCLLLGLSFPLLFVLWMGELMPANMKSLILFYLMGYAFISHGLTGYLVQFAFKELRMHGLSHALLGVVYLPVVGLLALDGNLYLMAFSWLILTSILSQIVGVLVSTWMINIRVGLALFIPAWCAFGLTASILLVFQDLWAFDNHVDAASLIIGNLGSALLMVLSVGLLTTAVYFILASLFRDSKLAEV